MKQPSKARAPALADQSHAPYWQQMRELERRLLLSAFEECNGDWHEAAARLGVKSDFLFRRGVALGIRTPRSYYRNTGIKGTGIKLQSRYTRKTP